jgi:hypothetical protein
MYVWIHSTLHTILLLQRHVAYVHFDASINMEERFLTYNICSENLWENKFAKIYNIYTLDKRVWTSFQSVKV